MAQQNKKKEKKNIIQLFNAVAENRVYKKPQSYVIMLLFNYWIKSKDIRG